MIDIFVFDSVKHGMVWFTHGFIVKNTCFYLQEGLLNQPRQQHVYVTTEILLVPGQLDYRKNPELMISRIYLQHY